MGLEDIKEQALEKWAQVKEQLDENPTINTIKEKYQTLPSSTQKVLQMALGFCFLLILIYIPYSYISSSSENVTKYNNNRTLIRELFKYGRIPPGDNALPTSANGAAMTSDIRSSLGAFNLLPEQILSIKEIEAKDTGKALTKPPIKSTFVMASFKQLNLNQIVNLSFHFKKFKDHIKLVGYNIKEDLEKSQYFNVDFKLVGYAFPHKKVAIDRGTSKTSKKSKKKRKRTKKRR